MFLVAPSLLIPNPKKFFEKSSKRWILGPPRESPRESAGLWRISVRSGACRNVKTGYAMIGQVYKDMLGYARICQDMLVYARM